MPEVHLRAITPDTVRECLALQVDESQARFIATNAKSLAEAQVNPAFVPLAIYDAAARGQAAPKQAMIGFVMYEVACGVGFIQRLMIDRGYQRQGYGRAALCEVLRRLALIPEVEMIGTSHRHDNAVAARFFQCAGFMPWNLDDAESQCPGEVFLKLPERC